jgi:hypothetical protein
MLRGEVALDHCMNGKPAGSTISRILSRLLTISPSESRIERRGFPPTPASARLERAGAAFIAGHNEAVRLPLPDALLATLASLPAPDRGFFAEGAAMGAAIRTVCHPWRNALSRRLGDRAPAVRAPPADGNARSHAGAAGDRRARLS